MAGRGGTSRLLGLGFMFGAKDDGATDVVNKLGDGMDRLADSTDDAAEKTSKLQKFGNAIASLNFLQLDRIGSAMEGLADKAGVGPGGAANSIESFGVQFNQTFKQATAGLGKYGDTVRKYKGEISGQAFNLGVDAGELTNTVAMLAKTGNAVEDYGLDIRSMAGSMQAGILGGESLGNVLTSLSEGYDLGAEGAGRHLDKITALGERFGVGKEAARGLEQAIAAADPVIAKFGNLKVDDVTESITRLALAGQQRLGGKFEDRMQDAIGVFSELSGAREELGSLVTGLGSDFPALAKEIGIATGDVGTSMEAILSDPLSFAQHMQKLMSTMDKSDPRFQRLKLSLGRLPAGFQFLIDGGEESAKALEAAGKPIENFEGSFKKMARGASGEARTFQERMDLLQERYENRLNKMTSQTDNQVVKRQRKAWKRLGKTIDDMRKKGGPMAGLLQMALDVRRHGFVHGLIPTLDKFAERQGPLGKVARKLKETLPMFEGFGDMLVSGVLMAGKMAIGLNLMAGPLGKVLGGFKSLGKSVGWVAKKAFGPLAKRLGKRAAISTFFRTLPRFLGPVGLLATLAYTIYKNWDKVSLVVGEVWTALNDVWTTVSNDLSPAFEEAFTMISAVASDAWIQIKDGFVMLWDDYMIPFGQWLRSKLPDAFGFMTTFAVGAIYGIVDGAKILGTALAAAIDVGISGFNFLMSLDPIGGILQGFHKLAKFIAKTDMGKTLGFDLLADSLADFEFIDDNQMGKLKDSFGRAKKELGAMTAQYMSNQDKAAAAGERVRSRIATMQMEGATDEEEVAPRAPTRKKRRRARPHASRVESIAPATRQDRIAADIAPFLKDIERAVARGTERGAEKGAEKGVKRGGGRGMPRPADAGGVDR